MIQDNTITSYPKNQISRSDNFFTSTFSNNLAKSSFTYSQRYDYDKYYSNSIDNDLEIQRQYNQNKKFKEEKYLDGPYQPRTSTFKIEQLLILEKLPFWLHKKYKDKVADRQYHLDKCLETNGQCCYNHYIGLPMRMGERKPIFDYQYNLVEKVYEMWDICAILKATGMGISEISVRYCDWKAHTATEKKYKNSTIAIVVGPNINLAKKIIRRWKRLYLDRLKVFWNTTATTITIPSHNNILVEAFPSRNIDALRSLDNVSIQLIDELDFFPPEQQKDVQDSTERYIGKSRTKIIGISTPKEPGGIFNTLEDKYWIADGREREFVDDWYIQELTEDERKRQAYRFMKLHYSVGLGKIFTHEDIEKAKRLASFPREYDLQYMRDMGNVLRPDTIAKIKELGKLYSPTMPISGVPKGLGIDPTYGGQVSKFAFVLCQALDNGTKVQVLHSKAFENNPEKGKTIDIREMENYALELSIKYDLFGLDYLNSINMRSQNLTLGQIICDSSNNFYIESLKKIIDENEYDRYVKNDPFSRYNYGNSNTISSNVHGYGNSDLSPEERKRKWLDEQRSQKVRPIVFATNTVKMQQRLIYLAEQGDLIINQEENPELITELESAKQDVNLKLIKPISGKHGQTYDLIDALKCALMAFDMHFV